MGKDTHDSVSRAERKAKKRKLEDAVPDLPGDDDGTDVVDESVEKSKKRKRGGEDGTEKEEKKSKKDKKLKSTGGDEEAEKPKKEKKSAKAVDEDENTADVSMADVPDDVDAPKKSKKERKAERKAQEAAAKQAGGQAKEEKSAIKTTDINVAKKDNPSVDNIKSTETLKQNNTGDSEAGEKKKKNNRNREKKRKAAAEAAAKGEKAAPRFIVFVGNLPFTANKESIEKHFGSVKPKSIRCLTQKDDPKKCKGCAFVEFEGYDHMKTCLKLFHHSEFNDGVSPPRKINVELTAGGGGKSKDRQAKIGEKNQKLNEQRIRRMQEEEKAKFTKKNEGAADSDGIHPSRRAIVPGA